MNGSTRQRMRKVEKLLSETKKEREERQRNWTDYAFQARCHATAVAVVVLSGEPKIGESLGKAWMRTLQHYRIHPHGGKGPRIESQVRAAEKLLPVIIGTRKGDSEISRIFWNAPSWLVSFTRTPLDALFLKFDLVPDGQWKPKWGSQRVR